MLKLHYCQVCYGTDKDFGSVLSHIYLEEGSRGKVIFVFDCCDLLHRLFLVYQCLQQAVVRSDDHKCYE
ncbi:hypothetical protein [Nostoc sp. TCL26-01]|uniref:hypothetical protein n=1 Tax=Nostoc sp. TCL26-01 TaxID=2576904 RepID=UPI0015BCDAE5|nr:hypothetical protein [Nostoc sp. TCL26-01]QLE57328.1 hypothetical protein FD725_18455 [Nostoc sp. TCL26-01]